MARNILKILIIFIGFSTNSIAQKAYPEIHKTNTLSVIKLTKNTYVHVTYLQTQSFGKVECNGMIVTNNEEALIFDTPADDSSSVELINFVEKNLKCKVKGVVVNHFHGDCLGGLAAFHAKGIPSYASNKTIEFAQKDNKVMPQHGFDNYFELKIGDKKVINRFFGEAHTKDNIVSYFPSEKVMFGGCQIKEIDATKGYLGDANLKEWSNTVKKIKAAYPKLQIVIPGHGIAGGQALFDYTIKLFSE